MAWHGTRARRQGNISCCVCVCVCVCACVRVVTGATHLDDVDVEHQSGEAVVILTQADRQTNRRARERVSAGVEKALPVRHLSVLLLTTLKAKR